MYRRMVNEGHTIGNHTYSHSYQTVYQSIAAYDNDFSNLQYLIQSTTGVTMNIMRFPGGSNNTVSNAYNPGIMDQLVVHYKEMGYQYFDWNVSAGDGATSGVTNTSVINNVLKGAANKNTAIILMHDNMPTTSNTLETIIISLANNGYRFQPLNNSSYAIHFK